VPWFRGIVMAHSEFPVSATAALGLLARALGPGSGLCVGLIGWLLIRYF
jgi:ATP:corrinoid adenosyltransferase